MAGSNARTLPPNFQSSSHPSAKSKIERLRDRTLDPRDVRALTAELTTIVAIDATKEQAVPDEVAVIVVLRAGLAMSDAFLDHLPWGVSTKVYHIGLYRDRGTLEPVEYYSKLPSGTRVPDVAYVLDPLIATGGTGVAVLDILRDWGVKQVKFVSLLASESGLVRMLDQEGLDLQLFVGHVDEGLDERGILLPGIGDIGDRLFNTHSTKE